MEVSESCDDCIVSGMLEVWGMAWWAMYGVGTAGSGDWGLRGILAVEAVLAGVFTVA